MKENATIYNPYLDVVVLTSPFDAEGVETFLFDNYFGLSEAGRANKDGEEFNCNMCGFTGAAVLT